jgi:hypothetical protein
MNSKQKEINLNSVETAEYHNWIRMLEEVCAIQTALKENPNVKGLKQARSSAYNLLADIQVLMDSIEAQSLDVA